MNFGGQVCKLLALLGMHHPECKYCSASRACWGDLRKRLEELREESPGENPPGAAEAYCLIRVRPSPRIRVCAGETNHSPREAAIPYFSRNSTQPRILP